jgi:hypothetical protein
MLTSARCATLMRFVVERQRAGRRHPQPSRSACAIPLAPRISWRLGRSLCAQTRAAFHCLATLPAVLHTPLLQKDCNSSSIPLFGWPGEVAALLKRVVGGDAAAKAQRMFMRETPDMSERPPTPRMMGDDPRGHESPSCLMRDSRVVGLRPKSVAAPST